MLLTSTDIVSELNVSILEDNCKEIAVRLLRFRHVQNDTVIEVFGADAELQRFAGL
jgi:hypothetical protein